MSGISTHVLDVGRGRPAEGVPVLLELHGGTGGWHLVGKGRTDSDGRVGAFVQPPQRVQAGTYRLRFDTNQYFRSLRLSSLYPEITITFTIRDVGQSYHLPLLLSPFGYTTYQGS